MPYKRWEVVPEGLNHTRLTLAGALVHLVIDIKVSWHPFSLKIIIFHLSFVIVPFQDRECTLLEPSEDSPVSHLIGQPMTACQLLPVKPLYCTPFSFHWVLWYYCYCRDSRSVGSISTLSLTDTNTAPSVTKYALIFFPTE